MNYYTSLKAVELGKRGIRVNALLPGSTDTGMKKEFEKMAGGQDNLVKENGGCRTPCHPTGDGRSAAVP